MYIRSGLPHTLSLPPLIQEKGVGMLSELSLVCETVNKEELGEMSEN